MGKRKSYGVAQGQQGVASGMEPGQPFALHNLAAANGAIPAASYPIEIPIFTVLDRRALDVFNSVYEDVSPSSNEAAVKAAIDQIALIFNAAFAAAAASFLIVLRRRDSTGAQVGADLTLLDGTVTTLVAFARIVINASANFKALAVGDTVSIRITIQGAGAACPAFGGALDVQQ